MTHQPAHEVELYRDENSYHVFVDLPGFDADDVEVQWLDQRLSISAEHNEADTQSSRVFHHQVSIPRSVRVDGITASYRDDVLDVELPVEDETESPGRQIEVRE